MPTLRELQADGPDALFEGTGAKAAHVLAQGLAPERRLRIDRHHVVE